MRTNEKVMFVLFQRLSKWATIHLQYPFLGFTKNQYFCNSGKFAPPKGLANTSIFIPEFGLSIMP